MTSNEALRDQNQTKSQEPKAATRRRGLSFDRLISESQMIRDVAFAGGLNQAERELLEILKHPRFQRDESLHWKVHCLRSYENARYLMSQFPLTADDIETHSDRFYAIHEWTTLIDGTMSTIISIHYNLCLGTILSSDKARMNHSERISDLLAGRTMGVFLATELGFGNNVINMKTEARYCPQTQTFSLRTPSAAAQKYMPNTGAEGVSKTGVVFARLLVGDLDHGVFPFLVPIRDLDGGISKGIDIVPLGEKPGYELDNAMTIFSGIQIPWENIILDNQTRFTKDGTLISSDEKLKSRRQRFLKSVDRVQMGKIALSSATARGLGLSLKIAEGYLSKRKTFAPQTSDVSILEYSHVQTYMAESLAKTYAAKHLYDRIRRDLNERPDTSEKLTTRKLAILKIVTTQLAQEVLFNTREKIGAQGLFSKNKVMPFQCQLAGLVTAEGDNDILLIRIARELLMGEDYQTPKVDWAQYLLSRFGRRTDVPNMFRAVETKLVWKLRLATAWNIKFKKWSVFRSWNSTLGLAMDLARLHSYRVAVDTQALQASASHSHTESLFNSLAGIFESVTLKKFLPLFIRHSKLTSGQMKSLESKSSREIRIIVAHRKSLLAAFDIPSEIVDSPIHGDYIENHRFAQGIRQ